MLTADTITDVQIRDLRLDRNLSIKDRLTCAIALDEWGRGLAVVVSDDVRKARARCAEILNARLAGGR